VPLLGGLDQKQAVADLADVDFGRDLGKGGQFPPLGLEFELAEVNFSR
jgi:hypothetical protein